MTTIAVVDEPEDLLSALPVTIDVDAAHEPHVREYVEQVLGWQPVDAVSSPLMPPAIRIADVATLQAMPMAAEQLMPPPMSAQHEPASGVNVACVLLVTSDVSAPEAAAVAARHRPAFVVAWPEERDLLSMHVKRILQLRPEIDGTAAQFTIGGCAGGVGTTTVALALSAIISWHGWRSLAVLRGPLPARTATAADRSLLRSPDVFSRATAVDGVPRCRIVSVDDTAEVSITDESVDCVVIDAGVDVDVDVVVARPDGAAMDRIGTTTAAWAVIVGDGPVELRAVAQQVPGRQIVQLANSARVARAAAARRLPGAFPGAWLKPLLPLARQMAPSRQ
ncbi:MAG: hypothetical protein WD576_04220 [Nitriliruptoraceae bacterium]